ncbi:acyltransferase family protein [Microvirga sp. G4-2]|uniref:acyltransferase family protein n=1 Tax=Microvirga sp. G4-2 TaxID=3434467 RepID=UPI004043E9CD
MITIGFRPQIQGLRAVAVAAVLVYHIWPAFVPGGYVGVDVFFVISGYLITASLLKEVETTGRINIAGFYARRIRRLLPASSLVLLVVALCLPLIPRTQWLDIATSIAASALYFQNWILAAQAVDYLAADNAIGPLKHFWSLSVEEQYYIVWPLALSFAIRLARPSADNSHSVLTCIAGGIGLLSLLHSIYLTPLDPSLAYFATSTRVWELTLGGALALFHDGNGFLSANLRRVIGEIGLVGILVSCITYSNSTKFPGYAALLPTCSAALIIISGETHSRWSPVALLRSRGLRYFGDISYSLYLWHWPVLFFYEQVTNREVGLADGMGIIVLSCLLAHATKSLVEDVFRRPKYTGARAIGLATGCIGSALLAAGAVHLTFKNLETSITAAVNAPVGAAALTIPDYDWASQDITAVIPPPERARADIPSAYKEGCYHNLKETSLKSCDYGDPASNYKVVLIGDSHAAQWFPAFQEIVKRRPIFFRGVAKTSCAFSLNAIYIDALKDKYSSCVEWSKNIIDWLKTEKPDIVLVAQYPRYQASKERTAEDDQQVAEGMASAWRAVKSIGIDLRVIRPTPWFGKRPEKCLVTSSSWKEDCVAVQSEALVHDAIVIASEMEKVELLDFTQNFCDGRVCPVALGGVLVYRDIHHMTSTFAKTLSPFLEKALFVKVPSTKLSN